MPQKVVNILNETYLNHKFSLKTNVTFTEIEEYYGRSFNINYNYDKRKLAPDGGAIWMDNKYPILISEMKRQGTNDERKEEGKPKQPIGNAIERLGKILLVISVCLRKKLFFLLFAFAGVVTLLMELFLAKLYTLNSFFEINVIYDRENNYINKPFTCLLKEKETFTLEEMVLPMLKIAGFGNQIRRNKIGLFRRTINYLSWK